MEVCIVEEDTRIKARRTAGKKTGKGIRRKADEMALGEEVRRGKK